MIRNNVVYFNNYYEKLIVKYMLTLLLLKKTLTVAKKNKTILYFNVVESNEPNVTLTWLRLIFNPSTLYHWVSIMKRSRVTENVWCQAMVVKLLLNFSCQKL